MKKMLFFIAIVLSVNCFSQSSDEIQIRKVLEDQTAAWNRGDLNDFMQGYWKNDSLMFIGKSGVNWGWQNTISSYKKNYPDTIAMGKLSFDIILVKRLSTEYFFVVGKWKLARTIGDISGHYNLLFRKLNGKWLIVADHSS